MSNQKKLTKPMTQSRNLDNNTAQHITYQELIQAVADASDSDTRYGFFLGAGASVESGIPVAKALSEKWLRTIKNTPATLTINTIFSVIIYTAV
jgi:hypothetical protein